MAKKASKKAAKKKVTSKRKAKASIAAIRNDLEDAAKLMASAMSKAKKLNLDKDKSTARAFQQMNNAIVRVDAAIDELSS